MGADDKAGIAEIVTAAEILITRRDIPHGRIRLCFTPDEEIGRGADRFDVQKFGADFAFTLDGGELGELEYENFNAALATITIRGKSVHPGTAKGKWSMPSWWPTGSLPSSRPMNAPNIQKVMKDSFTWRNSRVPSQKPGRSFSSGTTTA